MGGSRCTYCIFCSVSTFLTAAKVNATRFLKKCSETTLFSDGPMRNYLAQTGDSDGVQMIDGAVPGLKPR